MSGSTVVVSSAGKLGVASSSARFKQAIKPIDKASEAVPGTTFRYKEEVDPDQAPQFGLVAEEVEKVDRQLVVHDEQGKPFTVRYEAVNAMLLNEFLKAYQQLHDQHEQIAALRTAVQKVTDKVEQASAAHRSSVDD